MVLKMGLQKSGRANLSRTYSKDVRLVHSSGWDVASATFYLEIWRFEVVTIHTAALRVSDDHQRCVGFGVSQPHLPNVCTVNVTASIDLLSLATDFSRHERSQFGLSETFGANIVVLMHHSERLLRFCERRKIVQNFWNVKSFKPKTNSFVSVDIAGSAGSLRNSALELQ